MYTSGSTGRPKCARLTHGGLAASVSSCLVGACELLPRERSPEEAYLAYLPLAHVFELTHELIVMILGIRIGYSGPNTLTDAGTMLKKGQKGDAAVLKWVERYHIIFCNRSSSNNSTDNSNTMLLSNLKRVLSVARRPTVMIAVPLILERLHSALRRRLDSRGSAFAAAFEVCYRYRLWWTGCGFDTPLLNRVLFNRMREALGGRIGLIVGGGAPLAPEVSKADPCKEGLEIGYNLQHGFI